GIAAAALLFPVLVLATTEVTGVTHWLRNPRSAPDPLTSGDGDRVPRGRAVLPKKPPTRNPLKYGDRDYTNTLGMKFQLIPAGTFMMGSSQDEIDHLVGMVGDEVYKRMLRAEGPEHPVEITQPFYMGVTEVTVGQFRRFIEANLNYYKIVD